MKSLLIIILCLATCTAPNPFLSPLANQRTIPPVAKIFLPIIVSPLCPWSAYGIALAGSLTTDTRQLRPMMRCNQFLTQAAENRAKNLADNNYFAHCDLTGKCANQYAEDAGCHLPDYYTKNGNNIESLVAGPADPLIAYFFLSNSPAHADHLFGRNPFFLEQMDYGIAAVHQPGSLYGHYYVFLIGICE